MYLVVVGDVAHLDIVEFDVRTERAAVFVFKMFTVVGSRHGGIDNDSVCKGERAEKGQ